MAHLTCAAHTRAELEAILRSYADAGIENILALGGDPPADLELPEGELHHAVELVRLARGLGDFSIGVAVHPEPHPRSPSVESDRRHSAEKLAEADFAITQFFFDAASLLRSRRCTARAWRRQAGDPGDHAGADDRRHQAHVGDAGLRVPGVARAEAACGRGRPRRGAQDRHRRGDEALPRAPRRRRARPALLHAQPLHRDAARSTRTSVSDFPGRHRKRRLVRRRPCMPPDAGARRQSDCSRRSTPVCVMVVTSSPGGGLPLLKKPNASTARPTWASSMST